MALQPRLGVLGYSLFLDVWRYLLHSPFLQFAKNDSLLDKNSKVLEYMAKQGAVVLPVELLMLGYYLNLA